MSETKETDNNTSGRRTMTLGVKRTVEQGHIRQNFSHGRSKSVLVETKRKRPGGAGGDDPRPVTPVEPAKREPRPEPKVFQKPNADQAQGDKRSKVLRTLSSEEVDARARVLQESRKREEIERKERDRDDALRLEHEKLHQVEQQKRDAEAAVLAAESQPVEQQTPPEQTEIVSAAAVELPAVSLEPPVSQTVHAEEVATAPVRVSGPTHRIDMTRSATRPATARSGDRATSAPRPDGDRNPSQSRDATGTGPRTFSRDGTRDGPRTFSRDATALRDNSGAAPRDSFSRDGQRPASRDGSTGFSREGQRPAGREGSVGSQGFSRDGQRPAPRDGVRPQGGGFRDDARTSSSGARPGAFARPGSDSGGRASPPGRGGGNVGSDTIVTRPERTRETPDAVRARGSVDLDDDNRARPRGRGGVPGKPDRAVQAPAPAKKVGDDRLRTRLTLANALDEQQRERSLASLKRQRERQKLQAMGVKQERQKITRVVQLPEVITIQELSNRMAERAVDIIKFLMKQGQMMLITDVIDLDTAELVAAEFGHTVKRVSEEDVEEGFIGETDEFEDTKPRAPVVTIMGHVDHGKTSLLDALRQTNVVAGEAGGITQHIGAYQVTTPSGDQVTFIDTPGHAAFTAMRARGAKVTDIVVLVVAADDGVMPQTIEAINHAKAAGVPIIVAINKIDKPDADPTRVRTDLLSHEIVVESMGGDTLEVEVSAKQRLNLDKLLEAIHLQAEVLDLQANPDRAAEGIVIEAKLERGRGPVGTVLVQRGTLRVGQIIVAGRAWGRVRALIDDKGLNTVAAGPSVPVEVLGFDSAPDAGDQLAVVDTEARARELTEYRVKKLRDTRAIGTGARSSLEQMMSQASKGGKKEFLLIVKGDVQGSVEAINASLDKLGTEEVGAKIIHWGVGGLTMSDVALAEASGAVIIAFNVRADPQAKQQAERDGIEIRYYSIIYDLVDDVKKAMSGLLPPLKREEFLGYAQVLEVFNISKTGKVAGCRITEGKVERGSGVRLLRDNVVIHEGKLSTLKRFKDEVKEVVAGQECGMGFEGYYDLKQGDQIECFRTHIETRTL